MRFYCVQKGLTVNSSFSFPLNYSVCTNEFNLKRGSSIIKVRTIYKFGLIIIFNCSASECDHRLTMKLSINYFLDTLINYFPT